MSKMEFGPFQSVATVPRLAGADNLKKGGDLLERIVSMLSKMMSI
jgi:hypothetical protein